MSTKWFSVEGLPKGAIASTSGRSLAMVLVAVPVAVLFGLVIVLHFVHDYWGWLQWLRTVMVIVYVTYAVRHLRSYRVLKRWEAGQ